MYLYLKFYFVMLFQGSQFFQNYEMDLRIPHLGDGSFSICRYKLLLCCYCVSIYFSLV